MRYIAVSIINPDGSVKVCVGGPNPSSVSRPTKDSLWRNDNTGKTLDKPMATARINEIRRHLNYTSNII